MESINGSKFVLDYIYLLYYKCHKINLNHDGSYIDYPDCTKIKKSTITPINKKDNKCFPYTVTVVWSNNKEIRKNPKCTSKK